MKSKCPYCANRKPCEIEPASDAADAPLIARCGHCDRILSVLPNTTQLFNAVQALRSEVAGLRQALGK